MSLFSVNEWHIHFLLTLQKRKRKKELTVKATSKRITKHIKSNAMNCALSLNNSSSLWWIYWAGESCFYSQMNLFRNLIGAIKNDIFIFRLGGLTRTGRVSYYSTQEGGFTGNLASLDVLGVLHNAHQWMARGQSCLSLQQEMKIKSSNN